MNLKPADMLKSAISSEEEFQRVCPLLADLIKSSKLPVCKEVISEIKVQIKSKKNTPVEKLRALKAFNTLMMVGNGHFLIFAAKKIMDRLGILASYKKELSVEMRAESVFGKNSASTPENRQASINFLNLLLEYIKNWAGEFGKAPDKSDSVFFTTYNKLKESGVRFPAKQQPRQQREERKSASKKLAFLEQVEAVLKLLEECSDQEMMKEYKEMLRVHKNTVENALQDAMNHNSSAEIELLLGVMDKITDAIDMKNTHPRFSDSKPASRAFMTGSPVKAPAGKKDNFDLFDLDIAPVGSFEQPKSAAFISHQPIILDRGDSGKNNLFPSDNPKFAPAEKTNLFPQEKKSVFPQEQSSLFPPSTTNILFPTNPTNTLFPSASIEKQPFYTEEKKIQNRSSLFPEERPYATPEKPAPQERLVAKDDSLLLKLKTENAQLLEALEMCKSLLKDRENVIVSLNKELADVKMEKDKKAEELAEALEVVEYLENKLKKKKEAEKPKESEFFEVPQKAQRPKEQDYFEQPQRVQKVEIEFFEPQQKKVEVVQSKPAVQQSEDFDLDFILGAKKPSPSPVVPQAVPVPVPAPVQAENTLQYRMGNCMEMGVLYESETLQVGFQVKRQSTDLFCILFIGNKSAVPITEVATELSEISMENFPMMMQPLKTNEELAQNAQTNRMIKAQLNGYTSKVPKITILVKSQGIESLSLKLPLTIARFLEPRQELPSSIWLEWKKLVFEEDTSVVQLAAFASFPEMCSFLCFGMGVCLYSNNEISDLSPVEVLGAGQFTDVLVMFLVGVTGNGTTAKFSIRCRNNSLRDALSPIIKAQISK